MVDPQGATTAIRKAIKPDGTWLIVDINGKDSYEENYEDPIYGMLYAISVLDCMAPATAESGAADGHTRLHRAHGQGDGDQGWFLKPQAA